MKEDFEKTYHEMERNHWWFKSRRNFIHSFLRKFPKDIKILDIGCSSGILLSELKEMGFDSRNLYGVDISSRAIDRCQKNGLPNSFVMDAQDIELEEKFDVIIASDCLEHLEDDNKAIRNWHQLLKDEGELYIFVPAFKFLWSSHDVANMHFRRYTKKELKEKLNREGLQIVKSSYWNFFLFIPVSLFRIVAALFPARHIKAGGDLHQLPVFVNSSLLNLINFENKLLKFLNFPFGVSTYCIVKNTNSARLAKQP